MLTLAAACTAGPAGLARESAHLRDGLFNQLYLADMGHFAAANAAYARYCGGINPPARACVQAPLPAGMAVAVDVILPPCGAKGVPRVHPRFACLVNMSWGLARISAEDMLRSSSSALHAAARSLCCTDSVGRASCLYWVSNAHLAADSLGLPVSRPAC